MLDNEIKSFTSQDVEMIEISNWKFDDIFAHSSNEINIFGGWLNDAVWVHLYLDIHLRIEWFSYSHYLFLWFLKRRERTILDVQKWGKDFWHENPTKNTESSDILWNLRNFNSRFRIGVWTLLTPKNPKALARIPLHIRYET